MAQVKSSLSFPREMALSKLPSPRAVMLSCLKMLISVRNHPTVATAKGEKRSTHEVAKALEQRTDDLLNSKIYFDPILSIFNLRPCSC